MNRAAWSRGTALVARRTLWEGLRSKSVRISTALLLLVALGLVFGPRLLGGDRPAYTVATIGPAPAALSGGLTAAGRAAGFDVSFQSFAEVAPMRRAIRDGDATIGVTPQSLLVRTDAPGSLALIVSQLLVESARESAMLQAGLSDAEVSGINAIAPPKRVDVGPVADEGRAGTGILIGIVLYVAIMYSGNAIAMAVSMEKSTRIAEMLLAVLRPSQILVGNVIGIGLQTLLQLLVLAVPVVTALWFTDGIDLPRVAAGDIGLGVAWFVLGYLMYAFLFAAAASLVDKLTEVASAIAPVSMVLVIGYMGSIIGVQQDPGSVLATFLSMFPLTSLMAMPTRWASGYVPTWQLLLSMALALLTAVALVVGASSVYRRALLVTGRRIRLRETLRGGRASAGTLGQ